MLSLLILIPQISHSTTGNKNEIAWIEKYVSTYQSSANLGQLLANLKYINGTDLNTLPAKIKNHALPKLEWNKAKMTFKFKPGKTIKIVSLKEGKFLVDGKPESVSMSRPKSNSEFFAAILKFLLPELQASYDEFNSPEGCRVKSGGEINPTWKHGGKRSSSILHYLATDNIPGTLYRATLWEMASYADSLTAPKCEESVDKIATLLKEANISITDFSCDGDTVEQFSVTDEDGRKLLHNIFFGYTTVDAFGVLTAHDTTIGGRASEMSYMATGELTNRITGKKSQGVEWVTCGKDAPHLQDIRNNILRFDKVFRYVARTKFCRSCGQEASKVVEALRQSPSPSTDPSTD